MNILTGCLAATSRQVAIDGFDIYEDANIGASMRITDVTDYSQYGLEEPQSRIVLEYAESDESDAADDAAADSQTSTIEILTGDYNDASGEYYARLAGDDSVYLVTGEYLEYFECTTDDLAAADDEEE